MLELDPNYCSAFCSLSMRMICVADLPGLLLEADHKGMAVGAGRGAVVVAPHDDGLLAGEPARQDHHHFPGLR